MSDEKTKETQASKKWENVAEAATKEEMEKPALEHPSYEELLAQFTAVETKANENWDKLLRCQADLDNQRRRHKLDLEQAHKGALKPFAGELLSVVDNLERSLEQKDTADLAALYAGVELTLKLFQNILEKFSVKVINPLDQPFDPHQHEAMSVQVHAEKAPGTVIAVLQKGYLLHDRLLRPAMVVVAKAAE